MTPHACALPHWLEPVPPRSTKTSNEYQIITDVTLAKHEQTTMPHQGHQGTTTRPCNTVMVTSFTRQHGDQKPTPRTNTETTPIYHKPDPPIQTSTITTEAPTLTPIQSKYTKNPRPCMKPDNSIQHHPAFDTLMSYATAGCPVECGPPWTKEHITAAIMRGPHISAKSPEAATSIRAETLKKVAQGYARIIKWDDIKHNPPKNLKISPVAAVPHKSRLFRTILDLSSKLRCNGQRLASVNENTIPKSNHKAMEQMGRVIWRIITTMAKANPDKGPIIMAKWDIKDGFWRLTVAPEDAWHFCYVLPWLHDDDPIELAVSTCLQMGWTESPPLFCTATETARDIGQERLRQPANSHHMPWNTTASQMTSTSCHPHPYPPCNLQNSLRCM